MSGVAPVLTAQLVPREGLSEAELNMTVEEYLNALADKNVQELMDHANEKVGAFREQAKLVRQQLQQEYQ